MKTLRTIRSRLIGGVVTALNSVYSHRLHRYGDLRRLLDGMGPRGGDIGEVDDTSNNPTGVSVADSIMLYEMIRERKPRDVLELGAGRSSAVTALAMGGIGNFVAVEDESKWIEIYRALIPPICSRALS